MSSQSQEDSIKEGQEREKVLFSFKAIGIVEIVLGGWLILLEILTVILAVVDNYWYHELSCVG